MIKPFVVAVSLAILTPSAHANELESTARYEWLRPAMPAPEGGSAFDRALANGRTWINLNYRWEHVTDGMFSRHANASTLRTALGFETGSMDGFRFLIEFEDVSPVGHEDYNSTTNNNGNFPVVADPDGSEVNQAYLTYEEEDAWWLRLGRQDIIFDNQRFIGTVAWRQNHQTYDAAVLQFQGSDDTVFKYGYIDNVNRIFGDANPLGDVRANAHIVNLSQNVEGVGKATLYYYDLDLEDLAALATRTYGIRFAGGHEVADGSELIYTAEYAQQDDTGSNPFSVDQDYYVLEVGTATDGVTFRVGQEHLGGSGVAGDAFSTPLALLHGFNGFADLFLATPAAGLVDTYAFLGASYGDVAFTVAYHKFESDAGSMDYGDEWDATLLAPLSERTTLGLKFAHYEKDTFARNVTKVMGWLTVKVL